MALTEKLTKEDLSLFEILRHPVLCGEFYRNLDIPEWSKDEFEYHMYQKEYLCDFNHHVSLCCGRSVGKTWSITDSIIWLLINNIFPNEYIVYTVPNKVHLEPVWYNLIKAFRSNSLLKNFVEPRKGINSSNYTIKLLNNAELYCRIAGQSGTGANVIGLHSPRIYLDEAGYYPWGTWVELLPVLNTWQDGYKMFVSGVPTGLRENNVLYHADAVDDKFSRHQTSAHENPRYTEEQDEENIRQYGGADSEDYIHNVLGRHGSPTFAVFDRRLMQIDTYPVYKKTINGVEITLLNEIISSLQTIPTVPTNDFVLLGIDPGYTDPASIIILYEHKNIIKLHARITLLKVKYPMQVQILDYLDKKFGQPEIIGIDSGSSGKMMVQELLSSDLYVHKNYQKRLVPVDFGKWLNLGESVDGEEIKIKTKPYSVRLLQEYTNSHKIVYSTTDMELITEMERMTYTKTPSGELTFRTLTPRGGKRGADHNTSAMLCAALGYFMIKDGRLFSKPRPKLVQSRWIRGL